MDTTTYNDAIHNRQGVLYKRDLNTGAQCAQTWFKCL